MASLHIYAHRNLTNLKQKRKEGFNTLDESTPKQVSEVAKPEGGNGEKARSLNKNSSGR